MLLSLHGLALLIAAQPLLASQKSLVQPLPSSQILEKPLHFPLAQVSPSVQALPSSHNMELVLKVQPWSGSQTSSVQKFPSLHSIALPGLQAPAAHTSPIEQTLPSSHAATLLATTQPISGSHASVVQTLPSSQTLAAPPKQAPFLQVSLPVHTLPSSQPAAFLTKTQPLTGSQASSVHGLPSLHTTALPALHSPAPHTSAWVQALLSSQGNRLATFLHPWPGSHVSVVQGLLSSQAGGMPGAQTDALQTSPLVQAFLSSQGSVLSLKIQPLFVSQLSSVHGLPSLHTSTLPAAQALSLHKSPIAQALPSSQGLAFGLCTQPFNGLQLSVVQGLLSSHAKPTPGVQPPSAQVSPTVHALLSLQAAVLLTFLHPDAGSQLSSLHKLPSPQAAALPATHKPPPQASPTVHALPSLHGTSLLTCAHPSFPSQLSVVQMLLSSQLVVPPGRQTASLQASPMVQTLPSSQAMLLALE